MQTFSEIAHYIRKERIFPIKRLYFLARAFVRDVFVRYSDMPYLEVFVTTRCNLRCEKCSNLIPFLMIQEDNSISKVISNIELLLKYVKTIYRFKIHGGEVFLHPELPKLIHYVRSNKKLFSIRLATNGSILPNNEILDSLSESKIVVQISDYEVSSDKIQKLKEVLDKHKIRYVHLKNQSWRDMGDFSNRESSRFPNCTIKRCTSMIGDELFICSRAAMALKENKISETNRVKFTDLTVKAFKNALKDLYTKPNEACFHCDGDTVFASKTPAGRQMKQ